MTAAIEELVGRVWRMFLRGMAPSEIDELFAVPPGTSHDCVVEAWSRGMRRDGKEAKDGE